jgi:hypothetical protein
MPYRTAPYQGATIHNWHSMYQAFDLGNGREAIRCTSGRTYHIVRLEDGTWTVEEYGRVRFFQTVNQHWIVLVK